MGRVRDAGSEWTLPGGTTAHLCPWVPQSQSRRTSLVQLQPGTLLLCSDQLAHLPTLKGSYHCHTLAPAPGSPQQPGEAASGQGAPAVLGSQSACGEEDAVRAREQCGYTQSRAQADRQTETDGQRRHLHLGTRFTFMPRAFCGLSWAWRRTGLSARENKALTRSVVLGLSPAPALTT